MTWVFAILVVLAMGGIGLVAAGRGAPMAEEFDDRPDALVPSSGRLSGEDLRRVRFSLTFRGYRMSEVDALLDRLAEERDVADGRGGPEQRAVEAREWEPASPDPRAPATPPAPATTTADVTVEPMRESTPEAAPLEAREPPASPDPDADR